MEADLPPRDKFSNVSVWSMRTFCLITGASRGFGQRMAIRFAMRLPAGSFLLLTARDSNGLAITKDSISRLDRAADIHVELWNSDLANIDHACIEGYFNNLAARVLNGKTFQQAILVHNAASMGDITRFTTDQTDVNMLSEYWRLNLTSLIILNSVFWKYFNENRAQSRLVIHVTSICAKQPFKSFSLYCAGKAARNMLLCTMAQEDPSIRVLNYAPGPIDTQMQADVRSKAVDVEIREMFQAMKIEGRLLTCDQSLDGLVDLLHRNSFDSGAHIDYYDLPTISETPSSLSSVAEDCTTASSESLPQETQS